MEDGTHYFLANSMSISCTFSNTDVESHDHLHMELVINIKREVVTFVVVFSCPFNELLLLAK